MAEATVAFNDAEEMLLTADFEDCGPLWYSSNYVFLAQLCAPDGAQFAAVYKPLRGESPLWDFPDGSLYKREVAAYELAKLLGWTFVPPTVVREGPEGIGSLQVFVRHDTQSHYFVQRENDELVPQLKRMCVFDYVANNADRKGGHSLLDLDGHISGHRPRPLLPLPVQARTVIWDWVGDPSRGPPPGHRPRPGRHRAALRRSGRLARASRDHDSPHSTPAWTSSSKTACSPSRAIAATTGRSSNAPIIAFTRERQ
jgi:hypothetical protein